MGGISLFTRRCSFSYSFPHPPRSLDKRPRSHRLGWSCPAAPVCSCASALGWGRPLLLPAPAQAPPSTSAHTRFVPVCAETRGPSGTQAEPSVQSRPFRPPAVLHPSRCVSAEGGGRTGPLGGLRRSEAHVRDVGAPQCSLWGQHSEAGRFQQSRPAPPPPGLQEHGTWSGTRQAGLAAAPQLIRERSTASCVQVPSSVHLDPVTPARPIAVSAPLWHPFASAAASGPHDGCPWGQQVLRPGWGPPPCPAPAPAQQRPPAWFGLLQRSFPPALLLHLLGFRKHLLAGKASPA